MAKVTIREFMTKAPHSIGEELPLTTAKEMMAKYHVRHLPVACRGKLVGIVSDRDITLAYSMHPSAKDLKVEDVMETEICVALPETKVGSVLQEMIERKCGSAVVADESANIVGIFTTIDALKMLNELVQSK